MTTFTWIISTTDYTVDAAGVPDRVKTVHWRVKADDNGASAETYGATGVDEDASSFSEADAITAVQTANPDIEGALQEQINAIGAPTMQTGRLWDIPLGTKAWRTGVAYAVDDVAIYRGTPWTCIQAHTSITGWMPPNVPALWSIQNQNPTQKPIWVTGESIEVDDVRSHEGTDYIAIQAHTTIEGWEPPNAPALWAII